MLNKNLVAGNDMCQICLPYMNYQYKTANGLIIGVGVFWRKSVESRFKFSINELNEFNDYLYKNNIYMYKNLFSSYVVLNNSHCNSIKKFGYIFINLFKMLFGNICFFWQSKIRRQDNFLIISHVRCRSDADPLRTAGSAKPTPLVEPPLNCIVTGKIANEFGVNVFRYCHFILRTAMLLVQSLPVVGRAKSVLC